MLNSHVSYTGGHVGESNRAAYAFSPNDNERFVDDSFEPKGKHALAYGERFIWIHEGVTKRERHSANWALWKSVTLTSTILSRHQNREGDAAVAFTTWSDGVLQPSISVRLIGGAERTQAWQVQAFDPMRTAKRLSYDGEGSHGGENKKPGNVYPAET